jgi:eukaryotic-like serine/threonine-protein kinase
LALASGTRLSVYEVTVQIGEGGMGEVYRARDTRLDRMVAIKVLPPSGADDPRRRERFDREARAISSLNHPHICTLYDVGRQDGIDFLVMELLDGEPLSERLAKGALPLEQALRCAVQIADALDAAHRRGIVHRDLKPANIFLARNGRSSAPPVAKLLDFGIAKAIAFGTGAAAMPPTLTEEATLLGTPQYMAPEQLEGREADARSDLFAFGAVVYEMLTGRRAFPGESQSNVIAAVLDSEPAPVATFQPLAPPALDHLVTTCLAKNPDERWQSAADVRRQLEWIAASARSAATPTTDRPHPRGGARSAWAIAAAMSLVTLVAAGTLGWYARNALGGPTMPSRVSRMTLATSGAAAFSPNESRSLAITPDGTRIVYVGNNDTQLFVRPLDQLEATAIATAGSPLNFVFVSPDGQWVGFEEGNSLKKVAVTGGPITTIQSFLNCCGAAWAPDDTIIVGSALPSAGLRRMSAAGGKMTELTHLASARGEVGHLWPEMLPGGQAVLFTIATMGGPDAVQVAVLDLTTGMTKVVVPSGSHAHYVASGRDSAKREQREGGHLVYTAGGTLRAVPFDVARLETRGTPVTVLPRLVRKGLGGGEFVVASDGTLAYVDAPDFMAAAQVVVTMVWVDRQGREEPLPAPPRPYAQPRLSPDGTRVAVALGDEERDIWVWDLRRQSITKLTFGPGSKFFPVWMPDGRRVLFGRPGAPLSWQPADGSGPAEELSAEPGAAMLPSGVTPDGTRVLFSLGGRDQMMLTLDRTRRVQPLIQTPSNERNGVVSSDGRWLAYESNSSGRFEIYVRPFPEVDTGQWLISTGGGTRPLWSPNGTELFYVAPDGALMAVRADPRGNVWSAGSPSKVLEGAYATVGPASGRTYDVSADGKRFLVLKRAPATDATTPKIIVVQHWFEELKRLAPLN